MAELRRINKYISDSGRCSRREADRLVEDGLVTINGVQAELGSKVGEDDVVLIDGDLVVVKTKKVYLAFNKPVGITCTTDTRDPDNIVDVVDYPGRIFPVGRLDKMSEGLIFLTNDGDIVNKILRAGNLHEKEYIVDIDMPINQDFLNKMANGVDIIDTVTDPCKIKKVGERSFQIVLTQGLNRQIRRMCEALGAKVLKLKRTRIMNIKLSGIKSGEWRYLTESEIAGILKDTETSSKVA